MVYEVKEEIKVDVTINSLRGKMMKKVDFLLDMPRTSPADLKILSEIIKDLDVSSEDKLMSFYDTMLKSISNTNRTLEEKALFSIPETKKVKEKKK